MSKKKTTNRTKFKMYNKMATAGLLGALLTFGSVSFYGEGRSVEDQQLAGLIMWVPGGLIYLIGGGWIAWRWLTRMWRRQNTRAAAPDL